jgi:hypothetical protein
MMDFESQRAEAWLEIVKLLDELKPGWSLGDKGRGVDCAIKAIRSMASTPQPEARRSMDIKFCPACDKEWSEPQNGRS